MRRIAVRRRKKSNPRFKRGMVYQAAMDVLRTATELMTKCRIVEAPQQQARPPSTEMHLQEIVSQGHDAFQQKRTGVPVIVAVFGGGTDRDAARLQLSDHSVGIAVRQSFWI